MRVAGMWDFQDSSIKTALGKSEDIVIKVIHSDLGVPSCDESSTVFAISCFRPYIRSVRSESTEDTSDSTIMVCLGGVASL